MNKSRQKHPITTNFVFSFSRPLSPWWFLKSWSPPPTQFTKFSFSPFKQRRRGEGRNSVYSPKNLWNNIPLFCVFPLEHIYVFWIFLLLFPMLDKVFCKDFTTFYNQIKHKAGNRFHPPTKNNKPMDTLQTKQSKGLHNFWEVKIFG